MKNLIRMSLFIFARAGLCLAVAAWIVGQWWDTIANLAIPKSHHSIQIASAEDSVDLDLRNYWTFLSVRMIPIDADDLNGFRRKFIRQTTQMGMGKVLAAVRLPHWLIVSLFTAFNIVLHFIYRKRPEGKPCEV